MDLALAYGACELVTRREAANFYYGIRLLPPDKRRGMCAVYAFARRVDDIGDGDLDRESKAALLQAERVGLAGMGPESDDPVLVALADVRRRFGLPLEALADLVDGIEMDVCETRYVAFDDLVRYCRRVAGSIGRLSLAIFGSEDPAAADGLADDLGVALQLTNILRDVREDWALGRSYLPEEDLARFGCEDGPLASSPEHMVALIRFEAERNREWFDRGLELLPMLDPRSASCVSAMAGIYRRILDRIEADPEVVLRGRISLPVWEKAWVAACGVTTAGARASLAWGARL